MVQSGPARTNVKRDAFSTKTTPSATPTGRPCDGVRERSKCERPHRVQAMPAERSGGAGRPEDAVRRAIDNVIDGRRAEQRVFIANGQPRDDMENRVTRLRKIHRAAGYRRNGIALMALRTRTNRPLP